MRLTKGSSHTITTEPFDGAPESPTATVVRRDGTELAEPACEVDGDSVTVELTAADHLDELDILTVTVTAGDQVQVIEIDVVGSNWVTLASLRREPKLDDTTRYPDDLLRAVRDEWEAWIEELCNLRLVPGYGVERHRGTGRSSLTLDANEVTSIRSVTVDGTPVTGSELRAGDTVVLPGGYGWDSVIEVHFEHGLTRPPTKLVREVRKAVRRELVTRNAQTPNDAIRETSPEGGVTIQYSTPNPSEGRFTGILSLDPIITELRRAEIGVA